MAPDSTRFFRICAAALLLLLAALYFRPTNHLADKADAPEGLADSSQTLDSSASAQKMILVAPDRNNRGRESGSSEFHLLLSSDDHESLINLYDRIYVDSSISESALYRDLILERASELIQDGNPDKASDLLNQYLAIYYADVDALIILGRAYRNQRLRLDAIEAFQKAHQYEHRLAVRQLIINQENNIIGELVQGLKEQNQNASIIDLYENLTQRQPEVPGYFIGLANAYAAEHRYNEAIRSLRYIQSDIIEGPKARALIEKFAGLKTRP